MMDREKLVGDRNYALEYRQRLQREHQVEQSVAGILERKALAHPETAKEMVGD